MITFWSRLSPFTRALAIVVLVAAIAAGVLINTAGFLQSKSEETGQQSSQQVTNRLQEVATTGTVTSSNTIDTVDVTVKKAPGSAQIDLQNVTVIWTGPGGSAQITHSSVTAGDGNFSVKKFKDADDSSPVINSPDDRLTMSFDVDGFAGNNLSEGSTVTIKMTTKSGGTNTIRLTVPESLSGKSSVEL